MKTEGVYHSIGKFRLTLAGIALVGLSMEACHGALVDPGGEPAGQVISTGLAGGAEKREVDVNLTFRWVPFAGAPHIRGFAGNRVAMADVEIPWDVTGWMKGESYEAAGAEAMGLPRSGNREDFPAEEEYEAESKPVFADGTDRLWVEIVVKPARLAQAWALSADNGRLIGIPRMFFDRPALPVVVVPMAVPDPGDVPSFDRLPWE